MTERSPARRPVRNPFSDLSPRQREVIELRVSAIPWKEVAVKLGISINTARHHGTAAFARLRVSNAHEAAVRYGAV